MTVKQLIDRLTQLKSESKITDDSVVLTFNDEFCEFDEAYSVELTTDSIFANINKIRSEIEYHTKSGAKHLAKDKKELLKNLTTKWKNSILVT